MSYPYIRALSHRSLHTKKNKEKSVRERKDDNDEGEKHTMSKTIDELNTDSQTESSSTHYTQCTQT